MLYLENRLTYSLHIGTGGQVGKSFKSFNLGDLEQVGQGQSLVGDIWRILCPTTFIFGTGDKSASPSIHFSMNAAKVGTLGPLVNFLTLVHYANYTS